MRRQLLEKEPSRSCAIRWAPVDGLLPLAEGIFQPSPEEFVNAAPSGRILSLSVRSPPSHPFSNQWPAGSLRRQNPILYALTVQARWRPTKYAHNSIECWRAPPLQELTGRAAFCALSSTVP